MNVAFICTYSYVAGHGELGLIAMHLDEDGKAILQRLHIERFVPMDDSLYEGVRELPSSVRNGAVPNFAKDRLARPSWKTCASWMSEGSTWAAR